MARGFALAAAMLLTTFTAGAGAQSLPAGFQITQPIAGRTEPTGVYFAHDGRVFVTEKSGAIWVYTNLLDPAPHLLADLGPVVHDYWDRGLLGFALDPRFPERPYVYVQYTYNGGLFGDAAPRWPSTDCPFPPGAGTDYGGCVVSGRLSRLTVRGDTATDEQVLIEDWYQQYPSHSIGTILFGPDGYLYAGGGEGASFVWHDYGQRGNPDYPDRRAPLNPAAPDDPATNQGGSLRAQGLEIEDQYAGRQVWLSGSIVRIDPLTGLHAPGNPLAVSGLSENARRIIAYGLRNPFRFVVRPDANELWIGDVGEVSWEEIDRLPLPAAGARSQLRNFGWPCYEGRFHHEGFDGPICAGLYAGGDSGGRTRQTPPWYAYPHTENASDLTGLVFYAGSAYPEAYRNSLFFADNSRAQIFNVPWADADGDGVPDAPPDGAAAPFFGGALAAAVQLTTGPGGDVFLTNFGTGRIERLSYCKGCSTSAPGPVAPSAAVAIAAGSTADGAARTVGFSAANSVDPGGGPLAYAWDFDGDGAFDDGTDRTASAAFEAVGSYDIAVRVTATSGLSDVARLRITVQGDAIFRNGFDPGQTARRPVE